MDQIDDFDEAQRKMGRGMSELTKLSIQLRGRTGYWWYSWIHGWGWIRNGGVAFDVPPDISLTEAIGRIMEVLSCYDGTELL